MASEKAKRAIDLIRRTVEAQLSGLDTADYKEVVGEIGADFDGRWDGIQSDELNAEGD